MGTCLQAKQQPVRYAYPSTALSLFSLPNPTIGLYAYQDALQEQRIQVRQQEIPQRAIFLGHCVASGLVSDVPLDKLTQEQSLVSMEQAIDEAISQWGHCVKIRRNPFTKTAKRRLVRLKENPEFPEKYILLELLTEALELDWLPPSYAISLIGEGEAGIRILWADLLEKVQTKLTCGHSIEFLDSGASIYATESKTIWLNLPTAPQASSHALRIAVCNALFAISEGIATFHDPQSLFDLQGRYMYPFEEIWEHFKSLVAGKDRTEINAILLASDPHTWTFDAYCIGEDDPQEIEPDSESFERLLDVLTELSLFQTQFNIATAGYYQDFEATCTAQIDWMHGQANTYPEHASLYQLLAEIFASAREFKGSGRCLEHILQSLNHESEVEFPLLGGLFVLPCDGLQTLGEEVDCHIESVINAEGPPQITIDSITPQVLTRAVIPITEAMSEAYRLIKHIESKLEEIFHVGN